MKVTRAIVQTTKVVSHAPVLEPIRVLQVFFESQVSSRSAVAMMYFFMSFQKRKMFTLQPGMTEMSHTKKKMPSLLSIESRLVNDYKWSNVIQMHLSSILPYFT